MNCWWLFLVLPWHPICAQAVLQLGTDSKKHLLKRQLVKSENYSFPTHDKEAAQQQICSSSSQLSARWTLDGKVTYWLCGESRFCMWIPPSQIRTFLDMDYIFYDMSLFFFFNETFTLLQHLRKHSYELHWFHCLVYTYQWQPVSLSSKSRSQMHINKIQAEN